MIRQEQCDKVCRILDNVLANRPTERDSLIAAVRKAFDALEQPEINCSEIPNNSDVISRQAAIDAVVGCTNCGTEDGLRAYVTKHSLENGWTGGIVDALDAIEQLPSVQSDDDRLERCRFEYVNACKILAHRTPDTRKKDIDDAYAVVRTLNPIFGEESF